MFKEGRLGMDCLKEAVVLITGSSAGIGRGTAVYFAQLGSKLSLTGRDKTKLDETVSQCVAAGLSRENVISTCGDLTQESTRTELIDKTIEQFGRLDVLVNNAGMSYTSLTLSTPVEQFDVMMNINVKSVFVLTQLATPHLIKTKGCVVNVSSLCGTRAMPEIGVYCMTKAAIDMFTQCTALELAKNGVRVNSVSPGTVVSEIHRRETSNSPYKTEEAYKQFLEQQESRHPLGRVAQPDDVAKAIAFLASDQSSFVTGQNIFIDGGRHCVCTTTAKSS